MERRAGGAGPPGARYPPVPRLPPAPELTVLVVLEVVVRAGPATAFSWVLHVVELQKVRPLAREAQEGGGQAPRQSHQPPGAGESGERAEGDTGRARPSCLGTGSDRRPQGSEPRRHPAPSGTGTTAATPGCGALSRTRGVSREREASRPDSGGPEFGGTRGSPPSPAPPGQVQRRPGGRSAPRRSQPGHIPGRCSGPSRRQGCGEKWSGKESGSRPGSASPAPSRLLVLLLPQRRRLQSKGPSQRACGGETLSLPNLPSRDWAFWPSQRLQAAAAPHRRWSPAQLQPGSAPRAGLEVWGAQGSEDLADTPLSARRNLGKARLGRRPRSCCRVLGWVFFFCFVDFFFSPCAASAPCCSFAKQRLLERGEHDIFAVITDKSPKCFLHCKHVHLNGNHGLAPSVTTSAASSAEPGGAERRGRRGTLRAA